MKQLCFAISLALLLSSCQKHLSSKGEVITTVIASDANSPLKSHSLTFTSDHHVEPGEVPPFSFTKTQYSDARVRTIKMLSRKNPIYPGFAKEAVELIGTFTYGPNTIPGTSWMYPHLAFLKGTSEVWEYYKNPDGTGARRSVSKKNIHYRFELSEYGYCGNIWDIEGQDPYGFYREVLMIYYGEDGRIDAIAPYDKYGSAQFLYHPILDSFNNITSFRGINGVEPPSYFRISYNYNKPRASRNFSFIPSQNLITQEFSLLEVMQWLPQSTHERISAGGTFTLNGRMINQNQVYQNYRFDANGNQTSITYGDNILQKTTWHVQP